MPIIGAGIDGQILVNDLTMRATKNKSGATRWLDIDLKVHIPGVKGSVDARRVGKVFAAEMIDQIRMMWMHGRTPDGRASQISKTTSKMRAHRRDVLTGAVISQDQKRRKKSKDERDLVKLYRYKGKIQIPQTVNGIETFHFGKSALYLPDPGRGALYDSGLMIHSLQGSYYTQSRSAARAPGALPVDTQGYCRIRVHGSRADAATLFGGLNRNMQLLNTGRGQVASGRFKGNFPGTAEMLDNLIYVNDPGNLVRYVQQFTRMMQLISKASGLLL